MKFTELVNWAKEARLTVTDKVALAGKDLYPLWDELPGIEQHEVPAHKFVKDERIRVMIDDEILLAKCVTPHEKQDNYKPSIHTASLWVFIRDENQEGTKENPIIVPEALTRFEYEYGKYYKEGETLYLCNRPGGKVGEKYELNYKPSALVGHYFKIV